MMERKTMLLSADEIALKNALLRFAESGYDPDSIENMDNLLDSMIANIGSLDGELRDTLIYRSFYTLLFRGSFDAHSVRRQLYTLLSPDFIERDIDDPKSLSVFARSFSVLFIDAILTWDISHHVLWIDDTRSIFRAVCESYRKEKNVRGYYKKYGWAHTVAHTADAFVDLIGTPYLGENEIAEILRLIQEKFYNSSLYLIDGEDERTANVIVAILNKDSSYVSMINMWLTELIRPFAVKTRRYSSIKKGNIRNLMRSVYFKIENVEIEKDIKALLLDVC